MSTLPKGYTLGQLPGLSPKDKQLSRSVVSAADELDCRSSFFCPPASQGFVLPGTSACSSGLNRLSDLFTLFALGWSKTSKMRIG